MTNTVEIEVLKPFNKTPQGNLADVGERFPVDETRAGELDRLGLAKRTDTVGRKAVRTDDAGVVAAAGHEARAILTAAADPVAESATKVALAPANKIAPTPQNKARLPAARK